MTSKASTVKLKKSHPYRIKNICAAANALGVHRGHLWAVLSGERESKPLVKRYTALDPKLVDRKYLNSPKRVPPSLSQAAAENLSPSFLAVLGALGSEVVIVAFKWEPATPFAPGDKGEIIEQLLCERQLETALVAASAGRYDSTHYNTGQVWHFFHASDLSKALHVLKAEVSQRNLLDRTTIFHVEESNRLRTYWPPTAEEVTDQ